MRDLYVVGDVHGNYRELIFRATQKYKTEHADLLILGDFGIGFNKPEYMNQEYNRSKGKLEKHDITINVLRGNHDDPSYFKEPKKLDYPRLHFLEDGKVYDLCSRSVFIIGGANSTDIEYTDSFGNHKHRIEGKDWWPGEDIERINIENLPSKVDVIASHAAPISFEPVVKKFEETSIEQYEKILEERKYLQTVLKEVVADYWYYGHYHNHFSGSYGNLLYRCLPPLEFFLVPEPENKNPQGEINDEQLND